MNLYGKWKYCIINTTTVVISVDWFRGGGGARDDRGIKKKKLKRGERERENLGTTNTTLYPPNSCFL